MRNEGCEDMENGHIGIALGSGSARGWAHIGIIKGLQEMGIEPDIVSGCSAGALVGGAYAAGYLDDLDRWARRLSRKDVVSFFDISLMSGGVIAGERLVNFFAEHVGDLSIESLPRRFAAVATDLTTGSEIWFKSGSLVNAVRASISLPGVFTPFQMDDKWLVDGGIVNPVPVSLCRAMGADVVIAVNLNSGLVGRHFLVQQAKPVIPQKEAFEGESFGDFANRIKQSFRNSVDTILSQIWHGDNKKPGLFDVMAGTINIMQDRITRNRMAGDPPDIVLTPRLQQLGLLEFHRASDAVREGRDCVMRSRQEVEALFR